MKGLQRPWSWDAWFKHAKTAPSRRKGLVRKLQKGVRSRLGTMHIMAKLKRDKEAAIVLQCLFRCIKRWRASRR